MSQAESRKVVTLNYVLKNEKGDELESSYKTGQPLTYLEGAGQIIPGLESQIRGLKAKEKKSVHVKAADAYPVEPELIVKVPRAEFPKKDVAVGEQFEAQSGHGHKHLVRVTEVTNDYVQVDGNLDIAGQALDFEIEIVESRDATKDELAHGHVHGPGGHHH